MIPEQSDLLQCAIEAVRAAGEHARSEAHRRGEAVQRTAHDVKLALDLECQERAEEVIRHHYPDHAVLGEESSTDTAPDAPRWIIDPIDGTVNFSHGLPFWCSSVALAYRGEILAGAVYAPVLGECFTATLEGAALCNDEPIQPSAVTSLSEALILAGVSKETADGRHSLDLMRRYLGRVQKIRVLGAAALDLCNVACGRAEAYIELAIFLWDVAAGGLIARRAGARTEILEDLGPHRMRYLCACEPLFEQCKTLVEG